MIEVCDFDPIIDAKSLLRIVSDCMELQIPDVLHRSYKLRRSGHVLNCKVVFLRCIQRHDLDQFLAMRTYITNFQY